MRPISSNGSTNVKTSRQISLFLFGQFDKRLKKNRKNFRLLWPFCIKFSIQLQVCCILCNVLLHFLLFYACVCYFEQNAAAVYPPLGYIASGTCLFYPSHGQTTSKRQVPAGFLIKAPGRHRNSIYLPEAKKRPQDQAAILRAGNQGITK